MDINTAILWVYAIIAFNICFFLGFLACAWAREKKWEKLTKETELLGEMTEKEMLAISTATVGWLQEVIRLIRKEMRS